LSHELVREPECQKIFHAVAAGTRLIVPFRKMLNRNCKLNMEEQRGITGRFNGAWHSVRRNNRVQSKLSAPDDA